MKILSVDTSANVATVAITEDDKLICEFILNNKLTHSQTLMPIIDNVLKSADINLSCIDLIAVANGPGSFTGLRIGVSAVKGLATALDKQVVGVSTLMAMAYNLPFCDGTICPIMDARRDQVYNALYKWEDGELLQLEEPRALGILELLEDIDEKEKIIFLGDGVSVHKEIIKEKLGDRAVFAPPSANMQRASALSVAAKKLFDEGKAMNSEELIPFYLRKSQEEREADERESKITE